VPELGIDPPVGNSPALLKTAPEAVRVPTVGTVTLVRAADVVEVNCWAAAAVDARLKPIPIFVKGADPELRPPGLKI